MKAILVKQTRRSRRKQRIRKDVMGTPERPRLTVYRSLKHIQAQVVDDLAGKTLVASSSVQLKIKAGGNIAAAKQVGEAVAAKAKEAGITQVVFDRNGARFHGRVKALADAARKAGLKF